MRFKKLAFFAITSLMAFSCNKEQEAIATDSDTPLTLTLAAEVSVNDDALRALTFELEKNSKNQLVPMPKLNDGDKVPVHTMLKSTDGASAIATVNWTYKAQTKQLVLKNGDAGNSFEVSNFHPDNPARWYVSGFIGGERNGTQVSFEGERILSPATNAGDAIEGLKVPYSFGWAAVEINTESQVDANNSHLHGFAQLPNQNLVFKPHGALIAYKLGNNLSHDINMEQFIVSSDSYGDMTTFDMNTELTEGKRPTYTLKSCANVMPYSLRNKAFEKLPANTALDKTYYAWVIAATDLPSEANTRVTFNGHPVVPREDDYTGKYLTSYEPSTRSKGLIAEGRIHTLRAMATLSVRIPLEYLTEYNVAGGALDGYIVNPVRQTLRLVSKNADNTQLAWEMTPNEDYTEQQFILAKGQEGTPDVTLRLNMNYLYFFNGSPYRNDYNEQLPPGNYVPRYTDGGSYSPGLDIPFIPVLQTGSVGKLRMANAREDGTPPPNPHTPAESGYYSWYVCAGVQDPIHNPKGVDLAEGFNRENGTNYRMPEIDDWWGIYASGHGPDDNDGYAYGQGGEKATLKWDRPATNSRLEVMKVGEGVTPNKALMQAYRSTYSKAYDIDYDGASVGVPSRTTVLGHTIYAIRFEKIAEATGTTVTDCSGTTTGTGTIIKKEFYNNDEQTYFRSYFAATDNRLRCAYRYRRLRGEGSLPTDPNFAQLLIIDAVYLGEKNNATIDDISNPDWWTAQAAAGKMVSRTLAAAGAAYGTFLGTGGGYWDIRRDGYMNNSFLYISSRGIWTGTGKTASLREGLSSKEQSAIKNALSFMYTIEPYPKRRPTAPVPVAYTDGIRKLWTKYNSLNTADYGDMEGMYICLGASGLGIADYQSRTLGKVRMARSVGVLNANFDGIGMRIMEPDDKTFRATVRLFKPNKFTN